jgi:predicted Zn-ribbon and HTH transcriptional regulator
VADVIRKAGSKFLERYRQSLTWAQVKVLTAIVRCRTAALDGHRDRCLRCGYQVISYNSCRNRHCPKCQTHAREKWLHQRQQELLPVDYYHLVFSIPHTLVPLVWQNKKVLFTLLFEAAAATLLEVAADPKHLGAEIGFLSILHTWGQTLQPHPHLHCVVPGGGLSPDHQRWIASPAHFFLPVKVLSRVYPGSLHDCMWEGLFSPAIVVRRGQCASASAPGYNFRAVRQPPNEQLFGNLQYDLSPPVRCAAEHLVSGTHIFQWQYGSNLWGQLSAIKQGRNRVQALSCYFYIEEHRAYARPPSRWFGRYDGNHDSAGPDEVMCAI